MVFASSFLIGGSDLGVGIKDEAGRDVSAHSTSRFDVHAVLYTRIVLSQKLANIVLPKAEPLDCLEHTCVFSVPAMWLYNKFSLIFPLIEVVKGG